MHGATPAQEHSITNNLVSRRLSTIEWNQRRPLKAQPVLDPDTGLPVTGITYSDIPAYLRKRVSNLREDNTRRLLDYTRRVTEKIQGGAS